MTFLFQEIQRHGDGRTDRQKNAVQHLMWEGHIIRHMGKDDIT